MKHRDILYQLMRQNDGVITTSAAVSHGVRKNIFSELVREGKLVKLASGLYSFPNEEIDEYTYFSHRIPGGIFSHDTALYLHGLTTRMPIIYVMTIKSGDNISRIEEREQLIRFRYVKDALHQLGKITMETPFGRSVPVYDCERTILDTIKDKNNMDAQVFSEALKNYFGNKEKNLLKLAEYAKTMNMMDSLRQYTEVLL